MRFALIIPALDEAGNIERVVNGFRAAAQNAAIALAPIVVVDNGSRDGTAERARAAGAQVVEEPRRGYGRACLAGIAALETLGPPDAVIFADGDGSNVPEDLSSLLAPLQSGVADLVIGARTRRAEPGSLTLPQRFGNRLATALISHTTGAKYTDLGPFRAIRYADLLRLGMRDLDYGWTIEMQIKAARAGMVVTEVDVRNRPRFAGKSKISGTVRGVVLAGGKILGTVWKYRARPG